MKPFLTKLGIGLLLIFSGWQTAGYGDSILSNERLQQYKDLCANADTTYGFHGDSASVMTLKIKSAKTNIYTLTYNFPISGKLYTASVMSNSLVSNDLMKIWFDKTNPANNSMSDPCADLQDILKTKRTGSSWPYYVGGLALLLFGVSLTWGTIKRQIISLIAPKRERDTV